MWQLIGAAAGGLLGFMGRGRAARAARRERRQAIADEETRFVRLRDSAERGGFNPLTVLQSGFLGASLPSGFLSPDQELAAFGQIASNIQAGAGIGSDIVSARQNAQSIQIQRSALDLDRQRFGLDVQRLNSEIARDGAMLAHMTARTPGFGTATTGSSSLSSSAPLRGAVPVNGMHGPGTFTPNDAIAGYVSGIPVDANGVAIDGSVSTPNGPVLMYEGLAPAQAWEDSFGDPGEIMFNANYWARYIRDGLVGFDTRVGSQDRAVRDMFVNGPGPTFSDRSDWERMRDAISVSPQLREGAGYSTWGAM